MRLSTLRGRLSLRYFLLLTFTFASLGAGVYQALVWGLHRDLEAGLLLQAEDGARTVVAAHDRFQVDHYGMHEDPVDLEKQEDAALGQALLTSGRYAQLVDDHGSSIASTPALGSTGLVTPREKVLAALSGSYSFAPIQLGGAAKVETYGPGRETLEVIFYPVRAPGRRWALEVATPVVGMTEALQKVRLILLVTTPVLMLIAWLAGSYLLHRVLRRVDGMARAARHIGAQSLDDRLPEHGPDEIGQLGETFNEMLDRLGRAFDRMRRFTADASHELKTPLTSIRGDAEVGLMRSRSPEEYQRILARIVDETERMSSIVESLLILARADAGAAPLRRELVEAGDLVDEVVAACAAVAREAKVSIEVDVMPGLLIYGDLLFLRQMLGNLVGNAVKYNRPGGRVWVHGREIAGHIEISIDDDGPGIPAEHRPQIFGRFYRVDSSHSSSTGGSGLGLAIAKAIVDEHGGSIEVTESVYGGARFSVRLPKAAVEGPDSPDATAEDPLELIL